MTAPLSLMICGMFGAVFGAGLFGLPKYGFNVVMPVYIAEAYLTAIFYTAYTLLHPNYTQLGLYHHLLNHPFLTNENWKQFKSMMNTGSVIAASIAAEMLYSLILAAVTEKISVEAQEAFTITSQYSLANIPPSVNYPIGSMTRCSTFH